MRITLPAGRRVLTALAGLTFGVLVAPATAQAPELAMLDSLQPGGWDVQVRGEDGAKRVCVHTGRELIQIRHQGKQCSRVVVDDDENLVTIQYSCKGDGYGRTTIRKETAQLAQINSQGIEGGLPFHFNAEARRAGGC